jgi:20S proteasome subunit beta 4
MNELISEVMECLIGIQFDDFVLLSSDKTNAFSIIVVKTDENKTYELSDHLLMGVCGESGDTVQFAEFISKNIQLYKMRNGFELSPTSASTFIQRNLADYLRSRTPYMVNLLLAGVDNISQKPELYFMDYLATSCRVPYGMHGYGAYFVMSILDRHYKSNSTVEEGVELLRKCVHEIQKRLIINLPAFKVRIVDKDGIRDLKDIVVDAKAIGLEPYTQPTPELSVPMAL